MGSLPGPQRVDREEARDALLEAAAELIEADGEALQEGDSRDFAQQLAGAMSGLADARPPFMPDHVTITTMHGAKGLSADTVIVLQAEDEVIPGDFVGPVLNEARRLLYVSLTRAKRRLIVGACEARGGNQRFVGQAEVTDRDLTSFLSDYGLPAQRTQDLLAGD